MTKRVGEKTLAVILSVALLFGLIAVAFPAIIAQGQGIVVDDGDSLEGWSFANSTMEPINDGGITALKWNKAGGEPNMTAQRVFEQAQDFSSVADGEQALVFRMKTSDASKFTSKTDAGNTNRGIRIDLVSEDGMVDGTPGWTNRRAWTFPGTVLKSGEWTDVVLYCRNNDLYYQWEGAWDLSRIRAIYFDFNGLETDIALDSIRLVDVEDLGQGIDMDLDTLGDWSVYSGSIAVDTDSPKQGAGSMKLYGAGAAELAVNKYLPKPADLSGMRDDKSLSLWIRVEDASKISKVRIDLYSQCSLKEDGTIDWAQPVSGRLWEIPASEFTSGQWKQITLTENDSNIQRPWGEMDYSHVMMVSLHAMAADGNPALSVSFDDIRYSDGAEEETFDSALDSSDGWKAGSGSVSVNTDAPKQGSGSLQIDGAPTEANNKEINASKVYKNAVDLSGMNVAGSKSITVWVRVEDVSKLEKIRVNLFDEKSLNDAGDIASWTPPYPYARFWDIPASEFESGVWKQIQLTDATCSSNGIWTAPDYTLIKRVEFHAFALEANTQISVCFDDLRFGDCLPDEEPEGEGFNETFDTIDGWTAPQGSITVSTESPRQGAGSMLLSGAPAEALIAEKVYGEPMDLSGMAVPNGKSITLWVRIADVTKLQYLQIDMYDASCADASGNVDWGNPHLRRWNFPASDFKSGVWKQIQLTDFDTNIQNPWGCSMEYSQVRKLSFLAYVDGANTQADICFDDMQFADSSRPDSFNDNFDELNRWEATSGSLSVSGESPKEGTGSLYLSGAPQAPYTDLAVKRVYGTPMDLSAIAQQGIGSAALWVRVQDTAKMSKVVIDLADADGVNDEGNIIWDAGNIHVARWEFPVSFFESGEWIRIQLTADSPYRINPWNCEVDFSRIKLMVMGGQVTEPGVQGELYFDDLYYGDYELEGETTLDHMDSLSGWDSTAGSVAAKKDEEGRTLVELSSKGAPNTELNMNKYFAQPIDLSAVGRGEKDLVFRFKVNNRSEIQPGGNPQWQGIRIDVVGKGGYTNGVRNWTCAKAWEFANFRLENDNWATLSINAADANVYFNWPELNFSEVQGFSIILSVKAGCDIQLQLDRIYLSDPLEKEPDPVEPTVLDKMEDNYDGRWTADGDLIEDMVDHEQGDGALVLTTNGKETAVMGQSFNPRLDLRGISEKEKALSIWMKAEDITQISSVDVLLSMDTGLGDGSGTLTWSIPGDQLLNGQWKEFRLYVTDVAAQQDFEWFWVKSIHLRVNAKQEGVSVAFDTISIYDPHALDPDGSPLVDGPVLLNDFEKNNLGAVNGFTIDTEAPYDGNGSLKIDWGSTEIAYASADWKLEPRVNLGNLVMYGGTLEFYVYASDPSRFIEGPNGEPQFKLQIGGDEGPRNYMNCRWYNLDLASIAKAGEWTKVTIDFDKPTGDTMDQATYVEVPEGRDYNLYSTGYMLLQMTLSGNEEGGGNAVVMFDNIRAIPNPKPVDEDTGNEGLDGGMSFTPKVLDPSIVTFLKYKAVVKEDTTLEALLGALEAPEGYSVALVDDTYANVEDSSAIIRTGMWLMVLNDTDGVAVETYYVELGNPLDTSSIEDIDMPGRPGFDAGDPGNEDGTGRNPETGAEVAAAAILTGLAAAAALFATRRKRKR